MLIIGIVALVLGGAGLAGFMYRVGFTNEGFSDSPVCNTCGESRSSCACKKMDSCNKCKKSTTSCDCDSKMGAAYTGAAACAPVAPCPRVMEPDLSKYILKTQIPTCNKVTSPDMSNYMLKTECPPVPDLSKYILKSSIPKPQPVIVDNSKCKGEGSDSGECPPCPRPRCPVVKCPAPTKCPSPAPCPRAVCPPTVVKCKSEESVQPTVRPFLAPLNMSGFGMA